MYVCVPHTCLVLTEARRGHMIPGNWSYRWLSEVMWVLGMEPGSTSLSVLPRLVQTRAGPVHAATVL